jgi:hypothetical protein
MRSGVEAPGVSIGTIIGPAIVGATTVVPLAAWRGRTLMRDVTLDRIRAWTCGTGRSR